MTKYERINRKFETLFFPRIKKPIQDKINSLTAVVNTMGVHAGISYLNQKLTIDGLTLEVQRIYEVVGVRHANDVTRGLKKQPIIKKGFGFNDDWVRFIQLYLQNHLIENITFNVNKTLRDYLLRVLQ